MKTYFQILTLVVSIGCAVLHAQPAGISNSSVLTDLAPNGTATLGFIVSAESPQPLTALIRAVGPSLSAFGITNPVSSPHLRIFNGRGQEIARSAYIAPPPWGNLFALAGAFPLAGGETAITAYNVASVPAGSYSVQASDDAGKGGTVLIEVYLISGNFSVPPI